MMSRVTSKAVWNEIELLMKQGQTVWQAKTFAKASLDLWFEDVEATRIADFGREGTEWAAANGQVWRWK